MSVDPLPPGPSSAGSGIPYWLQYWASVIITVLIAFLGFVLIADPAKLGVNPGLKEWLVIVVSTLGVVSGFLPKVSKPPIEARRGLD